ncbi:hypothetical protein IAT40_002048 [Kwoniella sp. CBS 6097]
MTSQPQIQSQLYSLDLNLSVSPPSFHSTLTLSFSPTQPSSSSSSSSSSAPRPNSGGVAGACSPLVYLSLDIPEGLFVDPDEVGDKILSFGVRDWSLRLKGDDGYSKSSGSQPGSEEGSIANRKGEAKGKGKGKAKVDIERPSLDLSRYTSPNGQVEEIFVLDMTVVPQFDNVPEAVPSASKNQKTNRDWDWTIEIPLHGRYIPPNESGNGVIRIPSDSDGKEGGIRAGWECVEDINHSTRASPSTTTGDSNTTDSYLLSLSSSLPKASMVSSPVEIHLPTGKMSHQPLVESVTTLVIWLGWAWLVYKIIRLRSKTRARKTASASHGEGEALNQGKRRTLKED